MSIMRHYLNSRWALVLCVIVLCASFIYLRVRLEHASTQRRAVLAVLAGRYGVRYDFFGLWQCVVTDEPHLFYDLFGHPVAIVHGDSVNGGIIGGDEFAAQIADLSTLKDIKYVFWDRRLTDRGVKQLSRLRHLDNLYLWDATITDDGLEHIKELTSLKFLLLPNNSFGPGRVRELRKSLPSCEIIVESPARASQPYSGND